MSLQNFDRLLLVWLYRLHRRGFCAYRRWKTRHLGGSPRIDSPRGLSFEKPHATDAEGSGKWGLPAGYSVFGPKRGPMRVIYPLDGSVNRPKGIHGGHAGQASCAGKIDREGTETRLPSVSAETIGPGEFIVGSDRGGGGCGSPLELDPGRVHLDGLEKYVSSEKARDIYGVVFTGGIDEESLAVDHKATVRQRRRLGAAIR